MGLFIWIFSVAMQSCQPQTENSVEQNRQVVAKAFQVVGSGAYDEMDKYLAADYLRHCQATPEISVTSLDEFKEFIRQDRLAIPDQKLELKKLVAEGDLVAFWATYSGTQTGQMGPFSPSNRHAKLDFAGMHRMVDGKIAETWITWDNVAILTQLGHFPSTQVVNDPTGVQ